MYYIRIKEDYLNFLKEKESRIPNYDYGEGKYKPFYVLDKLNEGDILYVTQITSPKTRHYRLKETLDFKKLYHPRNGKYIGATNLNYMFPVLPEYIEHLSLSDVKEIVKNDATVRILAASKKALESKKLTQSFKTLYELKYNHPESKVAERCLDFKELEANLLEYKLQEHFERDDIKVERSEDYSTFFVRTEKMQWEYSEEILNDIDEFVFDMEYNLKDELSLSSKNELIL